MHRLQDLFKYVCVQIAGAVTVVVVDGGQCSAYDQRCLPGADKSSKEGFGVADVPIHW